jgi:hypothetical protein
MTAKVKKPRSTTGQMADAGGDFVSTFITGLLNNKAQAKAMRRERDAMVLNASSKSKATGTSTNLTITQSAEKESQVGRKALRLKGSAQASAASSNLTGTSVTAIAQDIEKNAKYSMGVIRRNAENAINVNRMRNKQLFDANSKTISQMKPKSTWEVFKGAAIDTALTASGKAISIATGGVK